MKREVIILSGILILAFIIFSISKVNLSPTSTQHFAVTVINCGNGSCDVNENCSNCPADCGACGGPGPGPGGGGGGGGEILTPPPKKEDKVTERESDREIESEKELREKERMLEEEKRLLEERRLALGIQNTCWWILIIVGILITLYIFLRDKKESKRYIKTTSRITRKKEAKRPKTISLKEPEKGIIKDLRANKEDRIRFNDKDNIKNKIVILNK